VNKLRESVFDALNKRFFYGWVILAVCATIFFASGPGQSHTFGIFFGLIGHDLGISGTWMSLAYGGATLAAAFGLPHLGRLVDRVGIRRMMIIVALFLGAACVGFAAVDNAVWLATGFAALRFLGQGSLMLLCATLVAQWFRHRRGFAMGVMALGFAASMAIHPPLSQWLVDTVGWRLSWVWLGVITWGLLLPLILVFIHDRPEAKGLRPDGVVSTDDGDAGSAAAEGGLTLGQAFRTPTFWIIAAGLLAPSGLVTGLFLYQVSIFETQGLSHALAARMFALSGIVMALSMPIFGRLLDRVRTEYVFSAALVLLAVILVAVTRVDDLFSAVVYAILFGMINASNIIFFSYIWARYFGRRYLGSIQGAGQMVGVIGAAAGPLPFGIAFDLVGSYTDVLLSLAVLPLAAAVLVLFLREPAALRQAAED
jgi:MFS family permease